LIKLGCLVVDRLQIRLTARIFSHRVALKLGRVRFLLRNLTVVRGSWVETAFVEDRLVVPLQRWVVRHDAVHGRLIPVCFLLGHVVALQACAADDPRPIVGRQDLSAELNARKSLIGRTKVSVVVVHL